VTGDDRCILAIDLGTSGPKVALTTMQGRVLGCASHPTELHLLPGGGAEQDPEDWWAAIRAATAKLHAQAVAPPDRVAAIAVTSQWAGTVAIDRDGTPLHRAIIWMDSRGAKYVRRVAGGLVRVEGYGVTKLARWVRRTGGAPSLAGKEPLSHILWLRHERPEVYRSAHKFLEPKDWLNLRLCGRIAATYDSIALHWVTDNRDPSRIDYDDELLGLCTLDRDKLPPLVGATDILGQLRGDAARDLGVPADIPVVGGTPDVQSAAIGSGAVRDFQAHVYLGTSSWLSCHVPWKKTDLFNNMASLPSALPGRYFLANEQETAGKCLEWLRDNVLCRDDALDPGAPPSDALARFDALAAESPAGSDGVIFTPWLYGERCPRADHSLRAAFYNQSLTTTRADLVRAVLEGVAYNNRWLLGAVEKFAGRRLDPIRVIGGGARSDLWCQIFADVLDREIEQVEDPVQCNARGAALLASLGLHHTTVDDIPKLVTIARRFSPRREHRDVYDAGFAAFLDIYRANRGIYARLHRH
jgi:xylulokinase